MLLSPSSSGKLKSAIVYAYLALLIAALVTIPPEGAWYFAILAFLAALYVADFISGMMHFILDYKMSRENVGLEELFHYKGKRGSKEYKLKKAAAFAQINILERIIFNFKLHHPFPSKIGRQSYAHLCSLTIIFGGIPVLLADFALRPFVSSLPLSVFMVTLSVLVANMQYIHALTHQKNPPRFLKFLMKNGVLLSKKKHAIHHATLDRDYCTVNGYANGLVNYLSSAMVSRNMFTKEGLVPRG